MAKRRRGSHVAAAPVALAAIVSVLFGSSAAQAGESPNVSPVDKLPKIKGLPSAGGMHHTSAILREDKYTVTEGDTVDRKSVV